MSSCFERARLKPRRKLLVYPAALAAEGIFTSYTGLFSAPSLAPGRCFLSDQSVGPKQAAA
jgi:hypothetical protein